MPSRNSRRSDTRLPRPPSEAPARYQSPSASPSAPPAAKQNVIVDSATVVNYRATIFDENIFCDCIAEPIEILLASVSDHPHQTVRIKKIDGSANAVTITPFSGEGSEVTSLASLGDAVTLASDGDARWHAMGSY